jgi:hypothetical protein
MNYLPKILHVLNAPLQKQIKDGITKGYTLAHPPRKVVCGVEYGLRVSNCSSYEKAVECLPALVAACGCEVELLDYAGLLVVRVIEKDWDKELKFNPKHLKKEFLLIGYDRLLEPVYHPFTVSMLEGGASGSGKTDWQRWICYQCLLQGYEVYICDMKGYSFSPFDGLVTDLAEDLENCARILEKLVKEIEDRKQIIKSKVFGERDETIATFKPIVVFIDEAADLAPSEYAKGADKLLAARCDRAISIIGRKGREPKVLCIYATQRPSKDIVNKQYKSNCEASIAFRTNDHYESQIIIDRPGAEDISPENRGRCLYKFGKVTLVQVPYIGKDKEWKALLAPLKTEVINGGTSKKSDKKRTNLEGSFRSTDSNDGANFPTVHERISSQTGQRVTYRPTQREDGAVLLAREKESMAALSQGRKVVSGWTDEI